MRVGVFFDAFPVWSVATIGYFDNYGFNYPKASISCKQFWLPSGCQMWFSGWLTVLLLVLFLTHVMLGFRKTHSKLNFFTKIKMVISDIPNS